MSQLYNRCFTKLEFLLLKELEQFNLPYITPRLSACTLTYTPATYFCFDVY